jgi:hypothetical protein
MRRPAMTGNKNQHPAIDEWIAGVDALLAEQREHSVSPSEGGHFPGTGEVQQWTTAVVDFTHSVEPLLDRLTNDPGRWVLVLEVDEAHDRFLRGVFYEDGSLVVETLGNQYGASSTGHSDSRIVDVGGSGPVEASSGHGVDAMLDSAEVVGGVDGEVGRLADVTADEPIPVLVGRSLPRRVVESDRSALPTSRLVRLSGPLPEPDMRLPPHPALHESL